jgi:hypothetical protein
VLGWMERLDRALGWKIRPEWEAGPRKVRALGDGLRGAVAGLLAAAGLQAIAVGERWFLRGISVPDPDQGTVIDRHRAVAQQV